MNRVWIFAALLAAVLFSSHASAAVGTIYIDTGGCQSGSTTRCSGTTDSASATASGAAATITCSATSGPSAAPGCSLSGSPSLAGIATDGSQAIFLNCATNSNQKIFFINAIDDALDLVGTTVTPTGCTAATSDWGIGGRMIYASANIEAALRAGDTVQFNNTPATKSAAFFTARSSGDSTSGFITLQGKTGVRPVLEVTNTSVVITVSSQSNWLIQNLELKQDGGSGNAVTLAAASGTVVNNVKVSAAGSDCINSNNNFTVLNSELTGCLGAGVASSSSTNSIVIGNYIHGNGANGITLTSTTPGSVIVNNVIAANTGRGIYYSGAVASTPTIVALINGNTIYNNTDSGLEVADADLPAVLRNNIFQSTGTPYNVKWAAGTAELHGSHGYNVFYISAGSNNVTGLTVNSTESTSNPNLTAPGSANFSINSTSSAAATGYPGQFLGSNLGYLDMGAVQRQVTAGGSSGQLRPGIGQ